jgi:hypothetical protein
MILINYFIKSRLIYGMSLFMGTETKKLDRIDRIMIKHIERMFDLPNNTSRNRLKMILGEPYIKYKLL